MEITFNIYFLINIVRTASLVHYVHCWHPEDQDSLCPRNQGYSQTMEWLILCSILSCIHCVSILSTVSIPKACVHHNNNDNNPASCQSTQSIAYTPLGHVSCQHHLHPYCKQRLSCLSQSLVLKHLFGSTLGFAFTVEQSDVVCVFVRIRTGLSYAIIYSSIMVKQVFQKASIQESPTICLLKGIGLLVILSRWLSVFGVIVLMVYAGFQLYMKKAFLLPKLNLNMICDLLQKLKSCGCCEVTCRQKIIYIQKN